jgi:primosomal protein N' (replication factor Y)
MLAKELKIPICLGSATPSLETWKNVQEGKYSVHKLTKRVTTDSIANIHVVDMKDTKNIADSGLPSWLSRYLHTKIQETLDNNKQVALFLNRRGLSQVVMCKNCGHTYMCPNCDISLSLHAKTHLSCHYCGFHEDLGTYCKVCKVGEPKPIGIGTEKIEDDIKNLFPHARTLRMDRDEVNDRLSLESAIRRIEQNEVDVIVGTQMIAKGLDFKNLTLVGILLADIGFNIPDFRAGERSFQLLTQVSGRAGRHSHGEVVIQTYNINFSSLVYAQNKDFEGFAENELNHRKELFYPPYGKLMSVRIQSLNFNKLKHYVEQVQRAVGQYALGSQFQVLGPAQAPIFKIKNKYRYGILVKAASSKQIREFYKRWLERLPPPNGVQLLPDIDPINTF